MLHKCVIVFTFSLLLAQNNLFRGNFLLSRCSSCNRSLLTSWKFCSNFVFLIFPGFIEWETKKCFIITKSCLRKMSFNSNIIYVYPVDLVWKQYHIHFLGFIYLFFSGFHYFSVFEGNVEQIATEGYLANMWYFERRDNLHKN